MHKTYKHPWYTALQQQANTMTSELESTPKLNQEQPGQTPTKKYPKCRNCGADTPEPRWLPKVQLWKHVTQCYACSDFKKNHGFNLTHKDRELLGEPKCSICGKTDGVMNIDHCHATNKVRGWLCPEHNRALGLFRDNIEHLQKAINYLSTNAQ